MPIEFMTDPLSQEDKKKMACIMRNVSKKEQKGNLEQNAVFLRKFVLSLMGQYYKGSGNPIVEQEIEKLNKRFSDQQKPFMSHGKMFIPPPSPLRGLNVPQAPSPLGYVQKTEKKQDEKEMLLPPLPPQEQSYSGQKQQEAKFTKEVYEKTFSTALTTNNQVAPGDVLPENILDAPRPD